jgi:regulator of cell morphogenesis and NO signaling
VTLVTGNGSPEIHNVYRGEVIMNFTSETKVKTMALSNPASRQVLEDAGVDYCCGGSKSLHEACLHADASPEEILNRLRENAQDTGPTDLNWTAVSLSELTRHIREKHHRYVREAIPRTQALSDKVTTKHGKNHTEPEDIGKLFAEVGREMIMHMRKEEQNPLSVHRCAGDGSQCTWFG